MDHELRLTTYSEFTIPEVVPEIPWRHTKIPIGTDLTRAAVEYALGLLGGVEVGQSAYLVCGESLRVRAIEIGNHFRLPVILLPPEMMKSETMWSVVAGKGAVYSPEVVW